MHLAFWKRSNRVAKEAKIALTWDEEEWWMSVNGPILRRTFAQALASTGIFTVGVIGIVALVRSTAGKGIDYTLPVAWVVGGLMNGTMYTLFGWWALMTAQRTQAIRSKRLREAMATDADKDESQDVSVNPPSATT